MMIVSPCKFCGQEVRGSSMPLSGAFHPQCLAVYENGKRDGITLGERVERLERAVKELNPSLDIYEAIDLHRKITAFDGEITDAMVRAGLAELWPSELLLFQNEAEVMARVYRAMVRLSPDFPLEDDPDEQLGKTGDRPVR